VVHGPRDFACEWATPLRLQSKRRANVGRAPSLAGAARRWSAPEALAELIQPGPRALERYRPQVRYLLIDEGRYAASELAPLRNLVAALFRLENSRSDGEVLAVVRSLLEWLTRPEQASLRRAFVVWINRVILRRSPGGSMKGAEDLQVMGTLIEARMDEWEQNWLRQGLERGLEEGLRKGEAQLLHRLLLRRFGALPDWVEARLQEASPAQLERWADRLLEARSLESLLDGEES